MRKMPWKYVEVEWSDPVSTIKWIEGETFPKPQRCLTRAWLVQDDMDAITLAATISDDDGRWVYSEIVTLPRGCIDAITPLRIEVPGEVRGL